MHCGTTARTLLRPRGLRRFVLGTFVVTPLLVALRFVERPFVVHGSSMAGSFNDGDWLIVDTLFVRSWPPGKGDPIVFTSRDDAGRAYLKRVVAVEGDTVVIENGIVTTAGKHERNVSVVAAVRVNGSTSNRDELTIGRGQYFVLGDDRRASTDSRSFGAVDSSQLIGRPILRLLPVGRMTVRP